MNEIEIDIASRNKHDCPNVRKGILLLWRLMRAVNAQSDGWAYCSAPRNSAKNLIELLKTSGHLWYDTHGKITGAQLRSAVVPIKAMVTRQKKLQKKFGNTFEFDVEAALLL